MSAGFSLKGAKWDMKELQQMEKKVESRVDKFLRKWAHIIEGIWTVNVAVDLGVLQNSIKTTKVKKLMYWVHDRVLYGIFVEWGTALMPARPELTNAVRKMRRKYFKDLRTRLFR